MNIPGVQAAVTGLGGSGAPDLGVGDAAALRRHAKLQDAAEQFEGMMLQQLLKPMQEGKDGSFGGFGGGFGSADDEQDRDGSLDTFSSYGTEAVANAIAKHGGLGIAKQVMRQIGKADGSAQKKS
jgi:peptidoglycan hydrolase FlgJ